MLQPVIRLGKLTTKCNMLHPLIRLAKLTIKRNMLHPVIRLGKLTTKTQYVAPSYKTSHFMTITMQCKAFWGFYHVRIQRGGTGGLDPPKNHKNIGFLSNTGPDPLKITKLPSQHSMLGHHQHASETSLKWCFTGGPMMAR